MAGAPMASMRPAGKAGRARLYLVPVALLGLLGLLATLQYRWVGQVSEADRSRMRATLASGAAAFAQDFDGEITRAYLLFQTDPIGDPADLATRFADRHARWQTTSRFPRLIRDIYAFLPGSNARLERFDPSTSAFAAVEWPASMADWRTRFADSATAPAETRNGKNTLLIRRIASPIWETAPAIVVPSPLLVISDRPLENGSRVAPRFSYAILAIDKDYVVREMLPALAEEHLLRPGGPDFQVAVVNRSGDGQVLYHSSPDFNPAPDSSADATTDFFLVRTQDFSRVSAEVRHFTTFSSALKVRAEPTGARGRGADQVGRSRAVVIERSIDPAAAISPEGATARPAGPVASWRLMLKHRSGSLETAVGAVRRRNLIVSTSVLAVLSASMALLMLSARRAQRLATQQMEFVATVSHELRTPLAVIRSAAENLADGVIADETRVKAYGALVRGEGQRLTDLVEQILELSGIESGRRLLNAAPVAVAPLLREVLSSAAPLIEEAGIEVTMRAADDVSPVLGDESALRRVFQNLVANAVKYGSAGGWIGLETIDRGSRIEITVSDRGIGIEPAEQARIFEPFYRAPAVVAAQVHGAGLGLSLVQRIVRAHGGTITVKSTPGQGAAFTVQLPAAS